MNKFHGSSAAKVNTGRGISPVEMSAISPNRKLNTNICITGWMIAQAAPNRVCL
jgi:hypothetical protein